MIAQDSAEVKLFAREASTWVYNAVYSFVQSKEDTEEIVQDTLIAALNGLKRFKNEASLKTWTYSIALNKSRDFIKYKSRQKRSGKIISIYKSEDSNTLQYEPRTFEHPGVVLESKEQMDVLFSAINKLSDNQKTALILAKLDRRSQKEISAIMKISVKAVESLLTRAKLNLRKHLEVEGISITRKKK